MRELSATGSVASVSNTTSVTTSHDTTNKNGFFSFSNTSTSASVYQTVPSITPDTGTNPFNISTIPNDINNSASAATSTYITSASSGIDVLKPVSSSTPIPAINEDKNISAATPVSAPAPSPASSTSVLSLSIPPAMLTRSVSPNSASPPLTPFDEAAGPSSLAGKPPPSPTIMTRKRDNSLSPSATIGIAFKYEDTDIAKSDTLYQNPHHFMHESKSNHLPEVSRTTSNDGKNVMKPTETNIFSTTTKNDVMLSNLSYTSRDNRGMADSNNNNSAINSSLPRPSESSSLSSHSASTFPPSFGFGSNTSMFMPSPLPAATVPPTSASTLTSNSQLPSQPLFSFSSGGIAITQSSNNSLPIIQSTSSFDGNAAVNAQFAFGSPTTTNNSKKRLMRNKVRK